MEWIVWSYTVGGARVEWARSRKRRRQSGGRVGGWARKRASECAQIVMLNCNCTQLTIWCPSIAFDVFIRNEIARRYFSLFLSVWVNAIFVISVVVAGAI